MVFIVVGEIKDVYLELCIRICKYYYGFFYIIKVYKFLFMIVWYYIDDEVCIFQFLWFSEYDDKWFGYY